MGLKWKMIGLFKGLFHVVFCYSKGLDLIQEVPLQFCVPQKERNQEKRLPKNNLDSSLISLFAEKYVGEGNNTMYFASLKN